MPNRIDIAWVESARDAWKRVTRARSTVRNGDLDAPLRDLRRAQVFVNGLHDALVYGKGFWTSPEFPIAEKKRALDLLREAKSALGDGEARLLHTKEALDPRSHVHRLDDGYLHRVYLVERKFDLDVAAAQMRDEALDKADAIVSGKLLRHLTRTVNKHGPVEFGEIPREVTVGRARLVFLDQPGHAWNWSKDQHRNPFNNEDYVKHLDAARQLLERRGLGHLWYGNIFVRCPSCGGTNPHGAHFGVGADYSTRTDDIRVYADPKAGLARLLVHEVGHRYYYKFMSQRDRAAFDAHFAGTAMTPQKVLDLLVTALLALDDEEREALPEWAAFNRELDVEFARASGKRSAPPDARVLQGYVRAFWPHLQPDVRGLLKEWHDGSVPATSEYGQTVSAEDFAEVFADYVLGASLDRDQVERFKAFLGRTARSAHMTPSVARVAERHLTAAQERQALRVRELTNLIRMPGSFGNLSAYRGAFSRSENKRRHAELLLDLQGMGYRRMHETKAFWGDSSEKALMVPGIAWRDLKSLGEKYEQDAVIWKDPSGTLGLYSFVEGTVSLAVTYDGDIAAKAEVSRDLYSKTRNVSFEFGFLFSQALPWKGGDPVTKDAVLKLIETGALVPPA